MTFTQEDNTNRSLPVMLWFHGGSWFMGSGNGEIDIHGPRRFFNRDIVLVTIIYRLGSLGRTIFILIKIPIGIENFYFRFFQY